MHPEFSQLMTDATALTRAGNVQGAMAAIAKALGREATPATRSHEATHDVIDVVARVIDTDATEPAEAPEASRTAQFLSGHYAHRAGARDYRLFVPAADPDQPRSLILMLHGCTQDPDDFARGTRMNAVAAAHNTLVLYPAQTRHANAQGCWNWFKHNHQTRDRGEPAILAGMVKRIAEDHGVDPSRIFVAGLSAGGAMAAILAASHPDVFAAAGVHSGLPAGAATDLPGALAAMRGQGAGEGQRSGVRMIVFHGDADATVHPSNGERVVRAHSASAVDVDEQRGVANGGRRYTRRLHKDAQGNTVAEQWIVHGAGHAWSGGDPKGSYADAAGPDASAEMLRFFLQQAS